MEVGESPYLNWLLQYNQSEFDFTDSYYFAILCENITIIYEGEEDKVDLSDIIEALKEEERERSETHIIRKHVTHLLRLASESPQDISMDNYNQHLLKHSNPSNGIGKLMRVGQQFHTLNSEVKLYIFFELHKVFQEKRKINLLGKFFAIDTEDNKYYCVNGTQLHVFYGKQLNDLDKSKNTRRNTILHSVEKFPQRPMKLLAETSEQWMEVAQIVMSFGEEKTSNSITQKAKSIFKEKRRVRFSSRIEEQLFTPDSPKPNLKNFRCHYYPKCYKTDDGCTFAHPVEECEQFNNDGHCERGRDCPFKHGLCIGESVDGSCFEEYCVYEHKDQPHPRVQKGPRSMNAN